MQEIERSVERTNERLMSTNSTQTKKVFRPPIGAFIMPGMDGQLGKEFLKAVKIKKGEKEEEEEEEEKSSLTNTTTTAKPQWMIDLAAKKAAARAKEEEEEEQN